MTAQLNERLVSLMDYVGSIAKDADAFARAQLPDVAREIVAWELWSGVVYGLICVAILAACVWAFRKAMWLLNNSRECYDIPMFAISVVLGVFAFVGLMVNTNGIIKATVAPRLVVLDYVKGVVK
jgi:hypothetical protein